jgi:predicted RNase H-like HicB family nuclease
MRVYNFSSGPAKLPEEVLQQAGEDMLSWHGKGYSIMETSHRSPEFTAIIEHDGDWFIAYSPEIPGANGQGKTKEECLQSLADAIGLTLADRREDTLRGIPHDAVREVVTLG